MLALAIAFSVGACSSSGGKSPGAATTPSTTVGHAPKGGLTASDIGITANEIHVGVVADVDNQFLPGLFQGVVDSVKGYANYINARGGVAGRKLVVDFYDSKLNPDEAANAMQKACEKDFALVGTSAIFFTNLAPIAQCKDKSGAPTGMPDLANVQVSFVHMCSKTSFNYEGSLLDCTTANDPKQTYIVTSTSGATKWAKSKIGITKGAWIQGSDIKSAITGTNPYVAAEQKVVPGDAFPVSAVAPQASYTPFILRLKRDKVDYVRDYSSGHTMALVLKEAALQGYKPKMWLCTAACYDKSFLKEAGNLAEGVYVDLPYMPIEDANVPAVQTVINAVGSDKMDGFVLPAWANTDIFAKAIERAAAKVGPDKLTRAAVLDALRNFHEYGGGGIIGKTDVGGRTSSTCFVLLQVKHGKFVRVHPNEAGKLDCHRPLERVTFNNNS